MTMFGLRPRRPTVTPAAARSGGKLGMMATLAAFFGLGSKGTGPSRAALRAFGYKRTQGNKMLPPHMQQEVMAAAQAKRERKLARPQGWYP
jgi:hypothetical protein